MKIEDLIYTGVLLYIVMRTTVNNCFRTLRGVVEIKSSIYKSKIPHWSYNKDIRLRNKCSREKEFDVLQITS